MTAPLSVQLYSLGSQPAADPAGVVARLSGLGYAGVEPVLSAGTSDEMREWAKSMGAEDMAPVDAQALRKALDQHGMVAMSSHAQLPEGNAAEAVLDEVEQVGSTLLVVPAVFNPQAQNVEAFDDLDRIKRIADRFNRAAETARPRGIRIGYHNHFWEFATQFDGRSGLECFYDLLEPDLFAEVDTYWAQLGGRDPVELITSLGDRALLLHVKDGDGQLGTPSCALGDGVVDVPGVIAAATSSVSNIVEIEGLGSDQVWATLAQAQRFLVDRQLAV